MKQVVFGTVAGLASAAAAQSATLSIVPSSTAIDGTMTTSFTLSIYASVDFGTHIAGGEFGLTATGGVAVTEVTGAAASWGAGFQNDRGHTGEGNHAGLVFGQLIFPPVLNPDPASALPGPVLLGVMTVTLDPDYSGPDDAYVTNWSTTAGEGAFILEVFDAGTGEFTQITSVEHDTVRVLTGIITPAPTSLALLGFGGLIGVRRSR